MDFIMKVSFAKNLKRGVSSKKLKSKITLDPDYIETRIEGQYMITCFDKAYQHEADKILSKIYRLEVEKESREACIYIVSQFHLLNRDPKGFKIIQAIFNTVEYRMLSSWSLIALLRTTYYCKQKIDTWQSLYDFTRDYFEVSGLDTKKELHGLNDD